MTDAEQWGPWIEHDLESVPSLGRVWVDAWAWGVWEKKGRRAPDGPPVRDQFWSDELHDDNWIIGPNDCSLIIRYRIRKPRGLTILENLIAHIPQREDA